MSSVLIVSPHRDDAAFSCAITISVLVKAGVSVIVANCFTVSEYAPFSSPGRLDVTALRLCEDRSFSVLAGIALNDLSLSDAPVRLQSDVSTVFTQRPFTDMDREPLESIAAHIRGIEKEITFVPLALGDHIDHRIAQAAALSTGDPCLAFYEDLPYAARIPPDAPPRHAFSLSQPLAPYRFSLTDGETWKRRCAALYSSQITPETAREIAAYSCRYGQGERLWVTPEALAWLNSRQLGT
ncbi:MAG: PIG-L family deacetylase, partial [Acidobacteriota bacterium]|nr:PIG-L family deacetylase [Acidobacteriota bacterium]